MNKSTSPSKTKRILVPIDFSEQSLKALEQAVAIAQLIRADIVLISVVEDKSSFINILGTNIDFKKAQEELIEKQEELFEKYKNQGVRMEPMVSKGSVHTEVAKAAEMLSPELVIMGTNGKPHDFKKRFVGSNAYRVVKDVREPVLTIKGNATVKDIKKIIFPYMLGRKSKEKVGVCLHYARLFNAEVIVVALAEDIEEQKQLPQHVQQIVDFINDHGVKCTQHMEHNEGRSYPQTLLDYTHQINGDMLVIMEDESVIAFHLWESDLEEVMYNSEVPVLCLTPAPANYGTGFTNI